MCTANERITNRNQVVALIEDVILFVHEEEEAGVKFNFVSEHSPYTEFGKATLHFDGDGCDMKAMRSAIDRIVTKTLRAGFVTEITATVSNTSTPWIVNVTFEFVF